MSSQKATLMSKSITESVPHSANNLEPAIVPGNGRMPRNVWVVTATSFLTDVSSEMVFNLLPLFLANVLGVRTSVIGLIEGTAVATSSFLKAYSGWLSDRLGRRKWITATGYAVSSIAKPFLYLATSWVSVFAIRFTDRLGKGIRTAPRDALIADSISESQRGKAFGLHRAGDTVGAALGIVITILLIWRLQGNNQLLSRSTFQVIALVATIPAVLGVVVLAVWAKDPKIKKHTSSGPPPLTSTELPGRFKKFLFIVESPEKRS
jgi:MFS family permease